MVGQMKVRQWVQSLGAMTAGNVDPQDAAARLAAYVPALTARFEAHYFTAASLAAVAEQCKFFPSYGEVCDYLSAYIRDNRVLPPPAGPAIAGAAGSRPLTGMDLHWFNYFHRRVAEIDAGPVWTGTDPAQSPRRRLESLVRSQSTAAWHAINGQPLPASNPTPGQMAAVSAAVAAAKAAMSQPDAPSAAAAPPAPSPAPKPVHLTREQLHAAHVALGRGDPRGPLPDRKAGDTVGGDTDAMPENLPAQAGDLETRHHETKPDWNAL